MKKITKSIILNLIFVTILININSNVIRLNDNGLLEKNNEIKLKNSGYWNLTGSPIFIDDLNPNYNWSKIAAENDWCTGSGTMNDPYIIENILIEHLDEGYSISIQNSYVYFIIRNCFLYNIGSEEGYTPIKLRYTNNGKITRNTLENGQTGIRLLESDYNTIVNNDIETQTYGFNLEYSNYNNVSLNSAIGLNHVGIRLSSSDHNIFTKNTIIYPNSGIATSGIELFSSINNTISGNHIENGCHGIYFYWNNRQNIIKNNIIIDNLRGMHFAYDTSINNTIYNNCFVANDYFENARDDGSNNHWDNGSSGNYWDEYSGVDNDNDGIGDSPYDIAGSAVSSDNFPLMECPFPLPQPESFNWFPVILSIILGSLAIGIAIAVFFLKFRKPK